MVNFYVPNYTKEEFEELDNKVLLLSKEKYSQLNIKFNDYDPTIDITNKSFEKVINVTSLKFKKNNLIILMSKWIS